MKIGIIGPNKLLKGDLEERRTLISEVAKIVAGSDNEIVLTPDKGSLLEYFGERYLEFGGKKIWLVIPTEEEDYKEYLNDELGEVVSSVDWDRQANKFNSESDIFVCIGYAWGGMKEIACAKDFNKKKIYVLNEFVSGKLPEELGSLVEYIGIDELEKVLEKRYLLTLTKFRR